MVIPVASATVTVTTKSNFIIRIFLSIATSWEAFEKNMYSSTYLCLVDVNEYNFCINSLDAFLKLS